MGSRNVRADRASVPTRDKKLLRREKPKCHECAHVVTKSTKLECVQGCVCVSGISEAGQWENNHVSVREQKGYICHSAFSHMHFDKAHEPATITRQTLLAVKNAHISHASRSMTNGMKLIHCSRVKSATVGVAHEGESVSIHI